MCLATFPPSPPVLMHENERGAAQFLFLFLGGWGGSLLSGAIPSRASLARRDIDGGREKDTNKTCKKIAAGKRHKNLLGEEWGF